jgi:hypothetical protein
LEDPLLLIVMSKYLSAETRRHVNESMQDFGRLIIEIRAWNPSVVDVLAYDLEVAYMAFFCGGAGMARAYLVEACIVEEGRRLSAQIAAARGRPTPELPPIPPGVMQNPNEQGSRPVVALSVPRPKLLCDVHEEARVRGDSWTVTMDVGRGDDHPINLAVMDAGGEGYMSELGDLAARVSKALEITETAGFSFVFSMWRIFRAPDAETATYALFDVMRSLLRGSQLTSRVVASLREVLAGYTPTAGVDAFNRLLKLSLAGRSTPGCLPGSRSA